MISSALATRARVNYARTGAAAANAMCVSSMSMGTCHWFKRIPAVAYPPPGVLEMV